MTHLPKMLTELEQVQKMTNGLMPLLTKSLLPHALDNHRLKVCSVMEMMVRKHDKFGWDQLSSWMRQMIREDWLAVLADYPVEEVRAACRQHTIEMPNKVPNEGHILAQIIKKRAAYLARQPRPVERPAPDRIVDDRMSADANKLVARFARRAGTGGLR